MRQVGNDSRQADDEASWQRFSTIAEPVIIIKRQGWNSTCEGGGAEKLLEADGASQEGVEEVVHCTEAQ
jgi:hypothetical protein